VKEKERKKAKPERKMHKKKFAEAEFQSPKMLSRGKSNGS
jgi:hypothetical protein